MDDRYRTGAYGRDNPGWHAEDAAIKAAGVLALLDEVGWRFDSVLDVGCGTGDVLRHLGAALDARGGDVRLDGWDVAAVGRSDARVTVHVGDALVERPTADVVLCLDVVEHVDDPEAFLRGLAALGPRLILRLPLDLSVLDVLRPGRLIEARRRHGHLHAWTRRTALALVADAGLRVVAHRLHRVPPPRDTARRHLVDVARVALVRAAPRLGPDLVGGFSLLVAAES